MSWLSTPAWNGPDRAFFTPATSRLLRHDYGLRQRSRGPDQALVDRQQGILVVDRHDTIVVAPPECATVESVVVRTGNAPIGRRPGRRPSPTSIRKPYEPLVHSMQAARPRRALGPVADFPQTVQLLAIKVAHVRLACLERWSNAVVAEDGPPLPTPVRLSAPCVTSRTSSNGRLLISQATREALAWVSIPAVSPPLPTPITGEPETRPPQSAWAGRESRPG